MPYVTSRRDFPSVTAKVRLTGYDGNPVANNTGFVPYCPDGRQTTYSFRTGKNAELEREGATGYEESTASGLEIRDRIRGDARNAFHRMRTKPYDTGHEFWTEKRFVSQPWPLLLARANAGHSYRGPVTLTNVTPGDGQYPTAWPNIELISNAELMAYGREAYNRTIPTEPEASLTLMLAELREKLPQIMTTQLTRVGVGPRTVGSEYLNWDFGVKPLIDDIKKLAIALLNATAVVEKYVQASGDKLHRKTTLVDDAWTEQICTDAFAQVYTLPNNNVRTAGLYIPSATTASIVDSYSRKVRFSGAFSYYLPEGDKFLKRAKLNEARANHLLGTRFTAETFWELTPWSWLLDWFADFGTLISNASKLSQDNTVLRYGYIMHEYRASRTISSAYLLDQSGQKLGRTSLTADYVYKERKVATPYGFSVDLPSMSAGRWATLAALGMTRGPRTLLRAENA